MITETIAYPNDNDTSDSIYYSVNTKKNCEYYYFKYKILS